VKNELLMVPLGVRVAGRWYLGVIHRLRGAWGGGRSCVTLCYMEGTMPVLRNGLVVHHFFALHAFRTRAMRAPRARLTRACSAHYC
jgi:hypothetical protein